MRAPLLKPRTAAWLCAFAVAMISLGATWSLIQRFGSDVPFWDQWEAEGSVILIPAANGTLDASAFWRPHNEHRIVFTKLINLGLAKVDGQWDPLLEMSVNALFHAAIAGLLLLFACGFLRRTTLLPAGLVVALAFALPFAWENSLGGFQSQFYLLELFALVSVWALLASVPLGLGWWIGFVFAVAGLGTMSSGFVAAASALGIGVGTTLLTRTRPSRRLLVSWILLAVICIVGVACAHRVPAHAPLEAASPGEWLHVVFHALAWPSNRFAAMALLMQAPVVLLFAGCVRHRRIELHDAVLLGFGLWSWLQVALVAYGRGHGAFIDASRYLDLFALGVCVNVLALARLWKPRPLAWSALAIAWLVVALTGFAGENRSALHTLSTSFADRNSAERAHVREAVLKNDPGAIYRAPADELPFPNPAYLVGVLTNPAIHALLPLGIRAPLPLEPEGAATGFSLVAKSALPGSPDTPFWSAAQGPARFVSKPLPASCLPVLHFQLAGSRGLTPASFWLEGADGGRSALQIGGFAGDRWQTANLRVPTKAPVRLHVDLPKGAWIAFSQPTEFGLYSWFAYSARKLGGIIVALGIGLFAVGMFLLPRQAPSAAASPQPTGREPLSSLRWLSVGAFAAMAAAVCIHLFVFVNHHAVNVLFWDQWDFYGPLFQHQGFWSTFTHQHGPHRQGLGFLITRLLAEASGWNSRWDAFGVAVMLCLATLLALALARRFGIRWGLAMTALPLAFLSLRQYEEFVGAANLSHGATPLMLIILTGLAWFIPGRNLRIATLTLLTFILIFTGFGMFMGVVTPIVLGLDLIRGIRRRDWPEVRLIGAALFILALSWTLFFHDYLFLAITSDLHPPPHDHLAYLWFMCLMFSNLLGVPGHGVLPIAAGFVLLGVLACISLRHVVRLLRSGTGADPRSTVVLSFGAFALVFAFNTALGRTWLGLAEAPEASRYVTLMIPALVALYLELARLPDARRSRVLFAAFALGLAPGSLHLRADDLKSVHWYSDGKLRWKLAYLRTHNEAAADAQSQFKIYPHPVEGRLRFLEQHHLNLFNPDGAP